MRPRATVLLQLGRWVTGYVVVCYFVALSLGLIFFSGELWLFISLFIAVQI